MTKYYRVVLINKETGEKQLTICKYRSLKRRLNGQQNFVRLFQTMLPILK